MLRQTRAEWLAARIALESRLEFFGVPRRQISFTNRDRLEYWLIVLEARA